MAENRAYQRRLLEFKLDLERLLKKHRIYIESTSCGGYMRDEISGSSEKVRFDERMRRYL